MYSYSYVFLFQCVAIEDVNPAAKVHYLVIPKKQITQLSKAEETDEQVNAKWSRKKRTFNYLGSSM